MKKFNQEDRNNSADLSNYVFGKVAPQAIPLEEAALGAIMLDKQAIYVCADILKVETFYLEAHQKIYRAMLRLFDLSLPIDLLTVMEELKKFGDLEAAGGPAYLAELTHRVASAANLEYHSRILAQKHIQRVLGKMGSDLIRLANDEEQDPLELIEKAEQMLYEVSTGVVSGNFKTVAKGVSENLRRIDEIRKNPGTLRGLSYGIRDMDAITGGLIAPDLIIVAARPGMGKTGYALSIARNVAKKGIPVIFFSLEMDFLQLTARLQSMDAAMGSEVFRRPDKMNHYENDRLSKASLETAELPIWVDDTAGLNITELRVAARRAVRQGAKLIIVDYLQLMTGRGDGNREQEVSSISRGLKKLAKELQVPIIALSQLSRAVETRGGMKRPQLSDLRESGGIEQDADIVQFIWRPEYYLILEDEDGNSLKGIAEIIVAKHRNGKLDTVNVRFQDSTTMFYGLDDTGIELHQLAADLEDEGSPFDDGPVVPDAMEQARKKKKDDEDIPF